MPSERRDRDSALLRLEPEPRRCSRRVVLAGLGLGGAGLAVWGRRRLQGYQPTAEDRVRARFVRDYLARTNAYDNVITGIEVRRLKLYVHTNLDPDEREIAGEIYDKLWREITMEHPEAGISYVILLDHRGNYLTGGQA